MHSLKPPRDLLDLTVLANFIEVDLAKHGHPGVVGINLLEKIQLPNIPSLYGAMLAGVDFVLMGAGISRAIPGILDQLAACQKAKLKIDVEGAAISEDHFAEFDPTPYLPAPTGLLARPGVSGDCFLGHAGDRAGEKILRPGGWLRDRRPHRRRPQRPATRDDDS